MKTVGDINEELIIASSRDIKLKIGGTACYLTKNGKLPQYSNLDFKETNDVESESKDGIYIQDGECYIRLKGIVYQVGGESANLKVQFVSSISDVDTSSVDSLIVDKSNNSLHFLINNIIQEYVATGATTSDTKSSYELPEILDNIVRTCIINNGTFNIPYYLRINNLGSKKIETSTLNVASSASADSFSAVDFNSEPFMVNDTSIEAVQSMIDSLNELQDSEVTVDSLKLDTVPLLLSSGDTENELSLRDIYHATPSCHIKDGYVYIYYKRIADKDDETMSGEVIPILTPTLSAIQSQKDNGNALKYLYTLRNSIICNSKIEIEKGDLDEIITKFDERISKLEETVESMKEILERIATTVENIKESTDMIPDLKTDVGTIKTKLESN